MSFFQVDAFAERAFTGNSAAVMPLDHWLPDQVTTEQIESRALAVLERQLLAPELIEGFEREDRRISVERGRKSTLEREALERRKAIAGGKFERFVRTISDGGAEFVAIRSGLAAANSDLAMIEASSPSWQRRPLSPFILGSQTTTGVGSPISVSFLLIARMIAGAKQFSRSAL